MDKLIFQKSLLTGLALVTSTSLAALRLEDDTGRMLTLAEPATRLISLSPHATELVYAAGAGSRLVAAAEFSDYPPAAAKLPRIGGFGGLDRERLLMLQPDLVVAWASGNKAGDLRWLQSQRIPVYLSEPEKLDDIANSIEKLGRLTGNERIALARAESFRNQLRKSCSRSDSDGQQVKSAYYEIWPSPAMTIGGHHWLNDVLSRAGLHNVFADQPRTILNAEAESVLARPAAVRISSFPSQRKHHPQQILIHNDPVLSRPGPRITEAISQLCRQLNTGL